MRRRIAVVTVGRSDYGIYLPVLRRLQQDPDIDLQLIVAAAHLHPKYGNTIREIERDGFSIAARVPMIVHRDSAQDVANAIGTGVQEFTSAYHELHPEIVLVLGDRYEMFAAAVAALPVRTPIAHIAGGELTFGAIDDAIRHCLTKLSHIHFATTSQYGRRIRQMGEQPWRVHVTGSPAIDEILVLEVISKSELETEIGLDLSRTLLITYHPPTLEENKLQGLTRLLGVLAASQHSLLFTGVNADAGNEEFMRRVQRFVQKTPHARLILNLGYRKYRNVQRHVAAMVGNSSSGITEAASFQLPVVNIGSRQAGRVRARNVIDVENSDDEIVQGIAKAVSPEFRQSLASIQNPYGDGHAAERIVSVLKSVELGQELLIKKFADYPEPAGA
jgi:GDP/UDP-N,N'-diacetylbacillosamine 2-epimerase (hydrolysing)